MVLFRSIFGKYDPKYKGLQYFTEDLRYSRAFGNNTYAFCTWEYVDVKPVMFDLTAFNKKWEIEQHLCIELHEKTIEGIISDKHEGVEGIMDCLWVMKGEDAYNELVEGVRNADVIKGIDCGNNVVAYCYKDVNKFLIMLNNKPI